MAKDFIGRGWRFPILPGPTGALEYSEADDNVEQSLRVLLLTRLGERVMRSDFGSGLGAMVFLPGSEQNLRSIEREVAGAITRFEPRVDVLGITAEADAQDATKVTIALSYRVRRTNSRESLVFPFYLVRGDTP